MPTLSGNPFNEDGALLDEDELLSLPAQGGEAITRFCTDTEGSLPCVLLGRRGFGKSHLLSARSVRHRQAKHHIQTLFHPPGRRPIDSLTLLAAEVPNWLLSASAAGAWMQVWMLAIHGLLVHLADVEDELKGYGDWFPGLLRSRPPVVRHGRRGRRTSVAENGADAPGIQPPSRHMVKLDWFLQQVVERLGATDGESGRIALSTALAQVKSSWERSGVAALLQRHFHAVVLYVDAPDELVGVERQPLWSSVQQGLLLAIWKLKKANAWNDMLSIFAAMRSDAFGQDTDDADVALARGITLLLSYSADDLKQMLYDRIQRLAPERLQLDDGSSNPLHALCGFSTVRHTDRLKDGDEAIEEPVWDALLRHTRRVPRELVAMAAKVLAQPKPRYAEVVREAVNTQAAVNLGHAIKAGMPGWNDAVHRRGIANIGRELIPRTRLWSEIRAADRDPVTDIQFCLRNGLLGVLSRRSGTQRGAYVQHFTYDEQTPYGAAQLAEIEYFVLHPSYREWLNKPEIIGERRFRTLANAIVGDGLSIEVQLPAVRLALRSGMPMIRLNGRKNRPINTAVRNEGQKLVYVVLALANYLKTTNVKFSDIRRLTAPDSMIGGPKITWKIFGKAPTKKLDEVLKNAREEMKGKAIIGSLLNINAPNYPERNSLAARAAPLRRNSRDGKSNKVSGTSAHWPIFHCEAVRENGIASQEEAIIRISDIRLDDLEIDAGLRGALDAVFN